MLLVSRRSCPNQQLERQNLIIADSSMIAMKILCGAASQGAGFDKCVAIGRAVNDQVVSIGSALDHCHVPGREGHKPIPCDVCVVGAGIHNEPVSVSGRTSRLETRGLT